MKQTVRILPFMLLAVGLLVLFTGTRLHQPRITRMARMDT